MKSYLGLLVLAIFTLNACGKDKPKKVTTEQKPVLHAEAPTPKTETKPVDATANTPQNNEYVPVAVPTDEQSGYKTIPTVEVASKVEESAHAPVVQSQISTSSSNSMVEDHTFERKKIFDDDVRHTIDEPK